MKTSSNLIAAATLLFALFIRPSFGRIEGEHIATSADHPVVAIQDTEIAAQRWI